MQNLPGVFIVLEGADGSGKGTQFQLLGEKLRAKGYEIAVFDFPRYEEPSSHFVRAYLNGEYGAASAISPYTASLFYALDRFEAAPKIRSALDSGKVVICNRYVGSNMAHQGSKFADEGQKRGFFLWEDGLEYQLLGIPRPTLNIYLRVPAEISYHLIGNKKARDYTDKSHDEHEADIDHLRNSVETYDMLAELFPKDFVAVDCTDSGEMLPINAIADKIWDIVEPLLPPAAKKIDFIGPPNELPPPLALQADNHTPNQPAAQEAEARLSNISLLALMALDLHFASYNLPKNIFNYLVPEDLSEPAASSYVETIDQLIKIIAAARTQLVQYSKLHPKIKPSDINQALEALLPLSAKVDARIKTDFKVLYKAIIRGNKHPLPEARLAAQRINKQVGLSAANDNDESQSKNDPQLLRDALFKIIEQQTGRPEPNEVRIVSPQPRNEFELLGEPYTDRSYEQKRRILLEQIQSGSLLDRLTYTAVANLDVMTITKLIRQKVISNLKINHWAPDCGYFLPPSARHAGLEDKYTEAYSLSQKLIEILNRDGQAKYTGYAVLRGQKISVQFTISGHKIKPQLTPKSELREFWASLTDAVSLVHPNVAEALAARQSRAKKVPLKTRHKSKANRPIKK